jgi:hypothetical protein
MIRRKPFHALFSLIFLWVLSSHSFAGISSTSAPSATQPSDVFPIPPAPATPDAQLDEIQRASINFFWQDANPVSGLSREYSDQRPEVCATGASGMECFNLVVGAERHFIPRDQVAARLQKALHFLAEKVDRFHGVFPHWFNGNTGKTIPFSKMDDGSDLVETAYLAEGLLEVRQYFTADDPVEADVRTLADQLWREIDWNWHAKDDGQAAYLLWHWSPNYAFEKNHHITGFNECQIAYILGLSSPTHPIPTKCYWTGWIGPKYAVDRDDFGVHVMIGRGLQMPMFFTHYSYLGLDPHALTLDGSTYFEQFHDLCKIQVAYARSENGQYKGYGPLWGITACKGPDGYKAFAPGKDNGTLAPTAALSSTPYDPEDSLSCLNELNAHYRDKLWGPYGFRDSFNLSRDWISPTYLGIDVGPIAPMIENYRTGLCWKTFMGAPEIAVGLKRIADSEPQTKP